MIRVFTGLAALSREAAAIFAAEAQRAAGAKGSFSVLLAGGETPRRTYQCLAREPLRSRVPWECIHLFWGDERCVPPDDPRSNALMVSRALLDRVPVPPSHVRPIPCSSGSRQGAEEYERTLRTFFADGAPGFDLVFLGLGSDGHTASLFPGSAALDETTRWTAVTRRPGEEIERVTVTLPVINGGAMVVFLVAGGEKADAVRSVLGEEGDGRLPAARVRPVNGRLFWFVDREAARLLPGET